jgi:hypothetical protein
MFKFLSIMFLCHPGESGGTGGASGTGTEDDKSKKDDEKGKDGEETITLTKAEYEAKLQQKFAEGARKAQGSSGGGEPPKKDEDLTKKTQGDASGEIANIKSELELLKGEKLALKQGIKPDYTEDAVALLKGKGLEINEANMKSIIEKHPEWKLSSDPNEGTGAKPLGATGGKNTPPAVDEATQAAKMFGF